MFFFAFVWWNRDSIRTFFGIFCSNMLFFVWNWIHLVATSNRQLYIPRIFWFHTFLTLLLSNVDLRAHSALRKTWTAKSGNFVVKKSQTCAHKMREKKWEETVIKYRNPHARVHWFMLWIRRSVTAGVLTAYACESS